MALHVTVAGAISGMKLTIDSSMSFTRVDCSSGDMVLSPIFTSVNPLLGSMEYAVHVLSITSLNWVVRRWHFNWFHHLSSSSFSSWPSRVRRATHVSWFVKLIVDWIWVLSFRGFLLGRFYGSGG